MTGNSTAESRSAPTFEDVKKKLCESKNDQRFMDFTGIENGLKNTT